MAESTPAESKYPDGHFVHCSVDGGSHSLVRAKPWELDGIAHDIHSRLTTAGIQATLLEGKVSQITIDKLADAETVKSQVAAVLKGLPVVIGIGSVGAGHVAAHMQAHEAEIAAARAAVVPTASSHNTLE